MQKAPWLKPGIIGAIVGGLFFGTLSEKIGRRRAICISALIALPVLPLWAFSSGAVLLPPLSAAITLVLTLLTEGVVLLTEKRNSATYWFEAMNP